MKPPAKESPAPVGSAMSSSGYEGAAKWVSPLNSSAPCSPFLMMTVFGPISCKARAALMTESLPVNCRASASFMKAMSTRFRTSIKASRLPSIQKFMVSQTVRVGFSTWVST